MRNKPIPLVTGFYNDADRPFSMQDVCNWLPCASESPGTRTDVMLKTPPGLSPLIEFGTTGPTRCVYAAEGRLFSVAGRTLFEVLPDLTAMTRGTIPSVGTVRAAHNQITGGNEVLFVNGSQGYVWNTVTATLTQITDPGYPGAIDAVFIDGYLVQIEPSRRFAFHSDLADALAYNTLDRFTSEVSPDLLVGMAVSNNELLLLSETTGEFFENTGAAQQPFRSKRISFQRGCAGRYSIAVLDNTVMWLGDDGMFYKLDGYSPRRISTRPIEQAIRDLNWSQCIAYVWESEGHSVCYWTFPDGLTFGYDASQPAGLNWHRRASYGLDRWRLAGTAYWSGQWVAGDFQAPRLWTLDWSYPMEGDVEMVREITGPVLHDNQNLVLMPRLEVVMDTGQPLVAVREFPPIPLTLEITGDLPDGGIGDTGTMQYEVTGGTPPYVVTIEPDPSELPGGATMDAAGLVTYDYDEIGFFSWVAKATDSTGATATVNDTATIGGEIFNWFAQDGLAANQCLCVFIDGDVIAVGQTNSRIGYSLDRAVTDFSNFVTPVAMATSGLVKYGGNWYGYGASGGVDRAIKALGDSMSFSALPNPPFRIPAAGNSAFLIDGLMYVAEMASSGENFTLHRTPDGVDFFPLNTGIAASINASLCSYAKSGAFHLFGTTDGKVLRSADLVTFAVVLTLASGEISVSALGDVVLAANPSGSGVSRSTDNGATFAVPYVFASRTLANGFHFIAANDYRVWTSTTGEDGSWVERLNANPLGSGVQSQGYATASLAAFGTFSQYAYVGDVS